MPSPRGQTLVLIAATLLLLTVMVCLTLSLSRLTKNKMQAQVASDAAAYSQAVAVARTYNGVALLNRAQAGELVASLGVESAISFAGAYRGAISLTRETMERCIWRSFGCRRVRTGGIEPSPPCEPALRELHDGPDRALEAELSRASAGWTRLDTLAGEQARLLNQFAHDIGRSETDAMLSLREQTVRTGALAQQVAGFSNPDLVVQLGAVPVNLREVDLATTEETVRGSLNVVAGSRVHEFIVNRAGAPQAMTAALTRALAGSIGRARIASYRGISYYALGQTHNTVTSPHVAWAEDDGAVRIELNLRAGAIACTSGPGIAAYVKSTSGAGSEHVYFGAEVQAETRHRVMGGAAPVPGVSASSYVWPITWDVNPDVLGDEADRYGQPKLLVSLSSPLSVAGSAALPWDLLFRFRFQPATSAGTTLDLKTLKLRGGEDLSSQLAVSTGLVYYHRDGHPREPPNLMNPFWRATLVHADVDATGAADFRAVLSTSAPPHAAQALDALQAAGYRAVP